MGQLLLFLVVALTVAAIVFGVTVLISGNDPGLTPVEPDGRAVPLPTNRPLEESDVAGVRFDTAVRGYRMAQVDQALQRAAYDIGYKDELIGVLEAEVAALREGRTGDAEILRRAREAAVQPAGPSIVGPAEERAEEPVPAGVGASVTPGTGPTSPSMAAAAAAAGSTLAAATIPVSPADPSPPGSGAGAESASGSESGAAGAVPTAGPVAEVAGAVPGTSRDDASAVTGRTEPVTTPVDRPARGAMVGDSVPGGSVVGDFLPGGSAAIDTAPSGSPQPTGPASSTDTAPTGSTASTGSGGAAEGSNAPVSPGSVIFDQLSQPSPPHLPPSSASGPAESADPVSPGSTTAADPADPSAVPDSAPAPVTGPVATSAQPGGAGSRDADAPVDPAGDRPGATPAGGAAADPR